MKQQSNNIFDQGLNYDLNPNTTPNNVLTDAINATFLTLNGDELALQNDAGNTSIDILYSSAVLYVGNHDDGDIVYTEVESVKTYYKNISGIQNDTSLITNSNKWVRLVSGKVSLSPGFYPLGIKEYGGILYIVSAKKGALQDGSDDLVEFGSYPSPSASGAVTYSGNTVSFTTGETTIIYKWTPTGTPGTCTVDLSGRNTGNAATEVKNQYSTDGGITWLDVVGAPLEIREVPNLTACPLSVNIIGLSVDDVEYDTVNEELVTPYQENVFITANTPIKSGFNYLFISIPENKILTVKNSLNVDITSLFNSVGTDDRPQYSLNTIYKKDNMFSTVLPETYYIKIS